MQCTNSVTYAMDYGVIPSADISEQRRYDATQFKVIVAAEIKNRTSKDLESLLLLTSHCFVLFFNGT